MRINLLGKITKEKVNRFQKSITKRLKVKLASNSQKRLKILKLRTETC